VDSNIHHTFVKNLKAIIMSKHFSINGYFKNDKSKFEGYIVKEYNDVEQDEQADDRIFEYGWSETDLKDAIKSGEESVVDFVITSYEEIKL
jgi:hypothetical protein